MLATIRANPVTQALNVKTIAAMLKGFRFRVCANDEDAARCLALRRRVYLEEKGLYVEVPDAYDLRSWTLLGEDAETGEAVGTMRLTPRSEGPLEAEESFRLPTVLRGPDSVEVSRFAIVSEYRRAQLRTPSISVGLFKLVVRFAMDVAKMTRLVVCSKAERVHTYTWLRFQQTGVTAPYVPFGGEPHEILFLDLRHGLEPYRGQELVEYFLDDNTPEVIIPDTAPALGFGATTTPAVPYQIAL
jgi:hypothetical protein